MLTNLSDLWRNIKTRNVRLIKRWFKHFWQRRTQGWDDSETFSLEYTTSKWFLPRLKRFKELNFGNPAEITFEKWNEILADMIYAHEYSINQFDLDYSKVDWKRVERGFKLFGEYYRDLWW